MVRHFPSVETRDQSLPVALKVRDLSECVLGSKKKERLIWTELTTSLMVKMTWV